MTYRTWGRRKLFHYCVLGVLGLLNVYFFVHLLYGNRGLVRLFELRREMVVARSAEKTLLDNLMVMKAGNVAMREPPDLDLLDERVRNFLGIVPVDEEVIFIKCSTCVSDDE